jgi:type I restriction enzyme S subunit
MVKEITMKQTEIGLIPDDWEVRKLGDLGDVKMCKRIFQGQTAEFGDVPFFKIGTFGKEPDAFITRSLFENFKNRFSYPKKGEILISAAGTIGRTVIYNGEESYFQDSNIVWINNKEEIISNYLLKYVLEEIKYNTEGGTIQRLYNNILKNTQFNCPPRAEQEAIAKALSDSDSWIEILGKVLTKKRLVKQGTMQKLLTPKKDWVYMNLGENFTLKARIGWQGLTTSEYLNSGNYRLITGTDFKNGFIDWDNCVFVEKSRFEQDRNIQLKEKDVLVTKDGTIGKIAFVDYLPTPTTLNSGVFVIRPKKEFDNQFLYYILMSSHFDKFLEKIAAGSTIVHLYQKDFVNFKIPAPISISEQTRIATILWDMDAEIDALQRKLTKAQQIKQGMMQELLTGRVRLV